MAIYFARAETTNFVKIGFAVTVGRRLLHLQAGCPYRLKLVREVEGDRSKEAAFHTLFAEHRLEREWFNWVPEMQTAVAVVRSREPVVLNLKLATYARQNGVTPAKFRAQLANHGLVVSQEIVRRWLLGEQPPGPKTVTAIESATHGQVTRYDVRPDIFGPESGAAA